MLVRMKHAMPVAGLLLYTLGALFLIIAPSQLRLSPGGEVIAKTSHLLTFSNVFLVAAAAVCLAAVFYTRRKY